MEYRRIGNSGLKVSAMGMGGNNFGMRADEEASIKVINHALEIGITYFDTAVLYTQGKSEEILGKALKGKRSQVILATKFGHARTLAPNELGGSRRHIMKAIDESLRRLNTDYIDLYYMHHPDLETPIEETLRALDDVVRAGKIRYIGCSNFGGWQLAEALLTSKINNLASFIAIQSRYNMLDRSVEREVTPCCEAHNIGFIPWGPLASGFLTGKYRRGQEIAAGMRLEKAAPIYSDIVSDENFDKVAKLEAFAKERGHSVGELAIAWLLSHPWLASVIAGAMSPEQLSANVAAADWKLTEDEVAQIDELIPIQKFWTSPTTWT